MIRFLLLAGLLFGSVVTAQDVAETRMVAIEYPSVMWVQLDRVTQPVEEAAKNAVILDFPQGNGSGSRGSGVYLGARYVATAWHVPEGTQQRGVATFRDGTRIPCIVNGRDSLWDQCIVTLDKEHPSLPGVEIAENDPVIGQEIYSVGFGNGFRIFGGAVTSFGGNSKSPGTDWVSHRNPAISGDSGGPMFDQQGRLIGCLWGSGGGETVGTKTSRFRVFVKPLFPVLAQWRANRIGRQIAGVELAGCPGGQCPPSASYQPPDSDAVQMPVPDPVPNGDGGMQLRGPQGEPGKPGAMGPAGADGKDGVSAEVSEAHLQTIISAVVANLKADPEMKGPAGPMGQTGQTGPTGPTGQDGKTPEIDYDLLAALVAARLPPVSLALIGDNGQELDRDTVKLGGTLRLQLSPTKP